MTKIGIGLQAQTMPIIGLRNASVPINAMGLGQSLIDNMDQTTFLAELPTDSTYYEGAVGGSALNKSVGDQITEDAYVDNTGVLADGVLFTSYLAVVDANHTSREDVSAVIFQIANSERNYVTADGLGTGEVTPTEFGASLDYLITRLRAEHGATTKVILGLPHRRYSSVTAQENYGFQQIREIYLDRAENDALIEVVEHCDIDLVDATHHTTAGTQEFGTRMGKAVNGTSQDFPILQSAVIDEYDITCTFSSDLTLPSSGFGQIKVRESDADMAIDSIALGGTDNVLVITMTDGLTEANSPEVYIGYGCNSGLAQTSADTLNNSAGTLPAMGAVGAITGTFPDLAYNGSVITSISGVRDYVDAEVGTKVYSSGTIIESITGLKGSGLIDHTNVVNEGLTFDATLFGGVGGFKVTSNNNGVLQMADTKNADGDLFVAFALFIPATVTGNPTVGGISIQNGSIATRAYSFVHNTSNYIGYARNSASGYPSYATTVKGNTFIIGLRYNSTSSLDFFVNSTTVSSNINPDANMLYNCFCIGSQPGNSNSTDGMAYNGFVFGDSALSNTDVATIMTELGDRYGVTVT